MKPVYQFLRERFPNVTLAGGGDIAASLMDAYRLLVRDDRSRIGWRLAIEAVAPEWGDERVAAVLGAQLDFADELPQDFLEEHAYNIDILRQMAAGHEISDEDLARLERAVGLETDQIRRELLRD
ncbi:MAG: hypothetical protein ACRDQZ_12040, partial [Mycobacteriales bacterium]